MADDQATASEGEQPAPAGGRPAALPAGEPLATAPVPAAASASPFVEGLRHRVAHRLAQLAAGAAFEQAEDSVEAVHDLRVASRRLRAVADTFRGAAGKRRARALGKPLRRVTRGVGALREWDVLAALLTRRAAESAELERAALREALALAGLRRERARRAALRVLGRLSIPRLEEAVVGLLARVGAREAELGLPGLAAAALAPAVEALGAVSAPGLEVDDEALHELRIRAKRLRYALELFEGDAPRLRPLRKRVTALQDVLGEQHDRVVLLAFLARVRRALLRRGDAALAAALTPVTSDLGAEVDELRERAFGLLMTQPIDGLGREIREALGIHGPIGEAPDAPGGAAEAAEGRGAAVGADAPEAERASAPGQPPAAG